MSRFSKKMSANILSLPYELIWRIKLVVCIWNHLRNYQIFLFSRCLLIMNKFKNDCMQTNSFTIRTKEWRRNEKFENEFWKWKRIISRSNSIYEMKKFIYFFQFFLSVLTSLFVWRIYWNFNALIIFCVIVIRILILIFVREFLNFFKLFGPFIMSTQSESSRKRRIRDNMLVYNLKRSFFIYIRRN